MNQKALTTPAMSSEQKRELLSRLLKEKIRSSRSYPTSFAQERLWFLNQFQPGPAYNIPLQLRFPGPFSEVALHKALDEIIRRHEVLRTTFDVEDGRPVQRIHPFRSLDLGVVDLRHLPISARESEAQGLAARESAFQFDLGRGRLFRATLVRFHDHDHLLIMTMHHIVSDGWSIGILMRELTVLYQAFSNGRPSPLPDLPIQYAEFAEQQRDRLSGDILSEYLRYWKRQLANAPDIITLPTDRVRPPVQTYNGAWQPFAVSADVTAVLQGLCKRERVTLFMVLLTTFKVLLHRYTGQSDIIVGTPIANRNRAEIEGLIGFFVNTLLLRTKFSPGLTFRDMLHRVREVTLEAYGYQDLPFEKLVEELQPDRDLSRNPMFQVMFVFQNTPTMPQSPEMPPSPVVGEEAPPQVFLGTAKFDVTLSLAEVHNRLEGAFEYNTDLFDHAAITRMIGHFRRLLAAIAANPDARIAQLPLLTELERRTLLEWNNTGAEVSSDACLHELFERQADRVPDKAAVIFESKDLTYAELERRSNQLAHALIELGAGADVRVGICLNRSLDLVVSILATLKAGAAYVPLDPGYPKDRLSSMMEDARIQILLATERDAAGLPTEPAKIVCLDVDQLRISQHPETRPSVRVAPQSVVALFYTSGSTGRPKASLSHGLGFLNLVHWYASAAAITAESRVLLMTPFTFDASFKNIMTPLTVGGTVVLADDFQQDVERLLQTFDQQSPTVTFTTPGLLYALLELARANDYRSLSSLERLFVGGEATDVRKLRHWLASSNCNCQVIHIYGPSECSDVTTIYVPRSNELLQATTMPIGKPIDNVAVYVVDEHLNLQPVGVPGELCISGAGLAWGFFGRPALTAEKFVPNPYLAGQRMYRTGDRSRRLSTGDIEFLGRTDNQVKIRGIRIELGEIETVLSRHTSVREAVVAVCEGPNEDKRIVAFIVSEPNQDPDSESLRRFLRQVLPLFMIPAIFVTLDRLPLSPNGKVDRNALFAPDMARIAHHVASPRNAVEEVLAGFWSELLGVYPVGIHDNFFDLGGHSLLATQLVSRLRDAFQLDFPLRRIFEGPTVAEMAQLLRQDSAFGPYVERVAPLLLKVGRFSEAEVEEWLDRRAE